MLPKARVRLLDVPVALFYAAERHTDDLLREVALVVATNPDADAVFGELLAAAETYAHCPAAVHRRVAESVELARRARIDSITVDVDVEPGTADAAAAWGDLLRRFDRLSRDERLLTLPAPPAVAEFRDWYVREVVEQVRTARDPEPWTRDAALAGAAR